jgi:site-specific recombinase XerD
MRTLIHSSAPTVKAKWQKVKRETGLYRYVPSGIYHARVRHRGRLHRESLGTTDLAYAKRKLVDYKNYLKRGDPAAGKASLVRWLEEHYLPTLKLTPEALKAKKRIISRIRKTWSRASTQTLKDIRRSEVLTWLNKHYGDWSESYWNSALSLIRGAFELAVDERAIIENPLLRVKYRKRTRPIRLTPSFEEFQSIVADIRSQQFNGHGAEQSADFVEFLGLAGVGQAEAAGLLRMHVHLDSNEIQLFRHKTRQEFRVPIYPLLRPLLEKLCAGLKPNERVFGISDAKKAIASACERLGLPRYSHRSFRRMFVTRALRRNIDVKTIASWQGHRDGGKLILDTYSDDVDRVQSQRMAQLLITDSPANVIPIAAKEA